MGDSSDSEEFYDAEEFTPLKGSKRSSLCKSTSVTDSVDGVVKDKSPGVKSVESPSIAEAATSSAPEPTVDDKNTIKSVVQGRRQFQELRRCMQTEEEDEGVMPDAAGSIEPQAFTFEHPFKIISHDTMSLQSMTSLGRIGRILSGASESQSNIRDTVLMPSAASREPSTISDDPLPSDKRNPNVLGSMEPDVIASTKANSLKLPPDAPHAPHAPHTPVAPPRKKKLNKLHGSQSLSTTDGDNLSVCTTDTDIDECRMPTRRHNTDTDLDDRLPTRRHTADTNLDECRLPTRRQTADSDMDDCRLSTRRLTAEKPHLHSLIVEPPPATPPQFAGLPSPASTIESLTREFQDSLELSQSKYASDMSISIQDRSETRHRSVTDSHDNKQALNGELWATRPSVSGGGMDDGRRPHLSGHSSLGSGTRRSTGGGTRRRSLGDAGAEALRTRTVSGHTLSDTEILDQVTVLNLDTGERVPLSVAEHKLPQCINPLSLHIMRLTSEYIATHDDDNASTPSPPPPKSLWRKHLSLTLTAAAFTRRHNNISPQRETDEESESVCGAGVGEDEAKEIKGESSDRQASGIKRKTEKLKRLFGSTVKRTVEAARSLAAEVSSARHKEDVADIPDHVRGGNHIKLRASHSHKGPYDFDTGVRHVQEMGSGHCGAVWCCKFSVCGRLLATAGQDKLLRVWVTRDAHRMFHDMRTKYNAEKKASPSPSQESLAGGPGGPRGPEGPEPEPGPAAPFCPRPFAVYAGHTSDLLDVSWSKNYFLLSSSMDKTVRLWHVSRGECLCCFQHIDFVTAIAFHPRDDRYFLSGSLDGKLRLWDIPDKKVAVWNEVDGKTKLITAANFCQNGKFAVVGTYDGRCIFYTTDQLKYHTQIDVRSTRGKNSTGRKISGIEPMPCDDKILVTSNDSRIRLYDLRDLNLSCKYKGYVNVSSQIKASFSHDGKYIVSGSENQCIYIWKTHHDYSKFTSVRRDRNDFWEGIKAHSALVTCAVFAPDPDSVIRAIAERERAEKGEDAAEETKAEGMVSSSQSGHVLVSADFNGCIKVFVHKAKPKHSSLPASALA